MNATRTADRNPNGHAHRRRRLPLSGALALLFVGTTGCEFMKPDKGEIKRAIMGHAVAMGRSDWKRAASFCDSNMVWQAPGRKLRGRAAIQGYINSVRAIQNLDNYYIEIEELVRRSETKFGVIAVVRVPIVVSSITMDYRSLAWRAKMIMVKEKRGVWKISGIQEGPRSKTGVPPSSGGEGGKSRRVAGEGTIIPEL